MIDKQKIKNLLQYTITSGKAYNGTKYEAGYHTLKIKGEIIKGQRNPSERLIDVPYDFRNKTVLDLGSNQGGMLFELQDRLKEGVGVDYDHRLVNVANKIRSSSDYKNLNFFVFDLEKEDVKLISNFVDTQIDVIFLLSVCMWIKNWKEICLWCSENSKNCLFESNGTPKQQEEQINYLKSLYQNFKIIREKSFDDKGQPNRKLYFFSNE